MFDQRNRGNIKNSKIQARRAELGMFAYEVKHSSGKENVAANALSRVCSVAGRHSSLKGLHESLGHPGITRLWHFVRSKNLPFPLEEVRQTCLNCHMCSVLKPRFYHPMQEHLVKATSAWERLSVDFKRPIVTSPRGNRFLLWLLTSIVGSCLPSLVKILLLLRSSNASPCYSFFLVFRLMFTVTEGQL